jgi:hypothetical protein
MPGFAERAAERGYPYKVEVTVNSIGMSNDCGRVRKQCRARLVHLESSK